MPVKAQLPAPSTTRSNPHGSYNYSLSVNLFTTPKIYVSYLIALLKTLLSYIELSL